MRLWRKARQATAPFHFRSAILSRRGTQAVNEDAAAEAASMGFTLLALADGLGGHARGEVASRLAVDRCVELFRQRPSLAAPAMEELVYAAHRALREAAPDPNEHALRSTLTLLVSDTTTARWGHVGDSRLYYFRGGMVRARSRDHSVPELLYRAREIRDEDIRHHPDRNRLLQTLGQETEPKVSVSDALFLEAGDAFLLCSDGWWENVPDEEMETALRAARTPQDWLNRMSDLIEAPARATQDNYTAIAALVG